MQKQSVLLALEFDLFLGRLFLIEIKTKKKSTTIMLTSTSVILFFYLA